VRRPSVNRAAQLGQRIAYSRARAPSGVPIAMSQPAHPPTRAPTTGTTGKVRRTMIRHSRSSPQRRTHARSAERASVIVRCDSAMGADAADGGSDAA
jgi:hypothetical protein